MEEGILTMETAPTLIEGGAMQFKNCQNILDLRQGWKSWDVWFEFSGSKQVCCCFLLFLFHSQNRLRICSSIQTHLVLFCFEDVYIIYLYASYSVVIL